MRNYPISGACGGRRAGGGLILQADHLNTRARNISYAEPDLIVCVCLHHHIFWKKQNPKKYEELARDFIGAKRTKFLDKCINDRNSYNYVLSDWLKIEIILVKSLTKLKNQ